MRKLIVLVLFVSSFTSMKAQVWDWGLGAAGIANVQRLNFGGDIRALIMLDDDVVGLAPQFNYYPGFLSIKEFYAGGHLQYNFMPYKKWGIYALAGGYYNQFQVGHDKRPVVNDRSVSGDESWVVSFEPGVGWQRNEGCFRPFAEARFNTKWKEANLRFGFLFMWGDCFPEPSCAPQQKTYQK